MGTGVLRLGDTVKLPGPGGDMFGTVEEFFPESVMVQLHFESKYVPAAFRYPYEQLTRVTEPAGKIVSLFSAGERPTPRYPTEHLDEECDNGTMYENVAQLSKAVIGHRIVQVDPEEGSRHRALILTLDDGTRVRLVETDDCCAFTQLDGFFASPDMVDHAITGIGTTEGYTKWHIYADMGDILQLDVGWSAGNPFFYGYGFDIAVEPAPL